MNTLSKMGIAPAPEYDAEGKPNPNAGQQGCCGKFCFSLCFCLTGWHLMDEVRKSNH